jgi:hypothetical protein
MIDKYKAPRRQRMTPERGLLRSFMDRVIAISRSHEHGTLTRLGAACEELEREALESGAMPGDFKVMMMYQRTRQAEPGPLGLVQRHLVPVLS